MSLIWTLLWVIGWIAVLLYLAYHKTPKQTTTLVLVIAFVISFLFSPFSWFGQLITLMIVVAILLPLNLAPQRKRYITGPLFHWFLKQAPKMSETERVAIEAGTVWWDRELFSGKPDWDAFFKISKASLTKEEEEYINGPVETLCGMLNDWEITNVHQDLPQDVWKYLRENQFFAVIIPKQYGGLEFSAFAHSEILTKIAGQSLVAASQVAVPNSLGPSELLLRYGTEEQKDYYLPRLASGEDIPCFALTNPEAGSDATAIPDKGVVCKDIFEGNEVLGIRLSWNKRYITLAPIATLLGLAFKLYDPDKLLGDTVELGITCALIPTTTEGVNIGRRHKPLNCPFQNGPTSGKNVFIPIDWIIGGPKMAGHGWRMLVECLSVGRAISLPSSAVGASITLACMTGAYARIRKQFKQPISRFGGIEEALARITANTYLSDAARIMTTAAIDRGEAPSVLGAIIKYQLTDRYRKTSIDAMDIHGGKGVMLGPKNRIANHFMNSPISITVEGANILTRCMIIFGQGVIRAHPYIMEEMELAKRGKDRSVIANERSVIASASEAIQKNSENKIINDFDKVIMKHVAYSISNAAKAFVLGLNPFNTFSSKKPYLSDLNRASAAFAFVADICMLLLGGKLKFKEKLSGRLADMLSMMYLASTVLKKYEDDGKPAEDKPLFDYVMQDLLNQFWINMEALLNNFPNRAFGVLVKLITMPLGKRITAPSDYLSHKVAQVLLSPNATRERLLKSSYYLRAAEATPEGLIEKTLKLVLAAEDENASIEVKEKAEELRKKIIAVDDFEEL